MRSSIIVPAGAGYSLLVRNCRSGQGWFSQPIIAWELVPGRLPRPVAGVTPFDPFEPDDDSRLSPPLSSLALELPDGRVYHYAGHWYSNKGAFLKAVNAK